MAPRPLLPGATLGVLGGGQLARMFAMAAQQMGYRVAVYAPDKGCPASQVCYRHHCADYEDEEKLDEFAAAVDVVTLEFENVPAAAVERLERNVPCRPGSRVLKTTQDRIREKSFLSGEGIRVAPFRAVTGEGDLEPAVSSLTLPAVLKTAGFGYDGRGQRAVDTAAGALTAYRELSAGRAVLEEFVDISLELSVIGARTEDGCFSAFGPVENRHVRHILDVSLVPALLPEPLAAEAVATTKRIMERLEVVGLLCVEFFLSVEGGLLVNELAPRPHNSGHLSIEACPVSQFEQQVRAVCGLPLGDMTVSSPAAMANLLGDLWQEGEPDWPALLSVPGVHLHLYGKSEARPGRKMGHITALAAGRDAAVSLVESARCRAARQRRAGRDSSECQDASSRI